MNFIDLEKMHKKKNIIIIDVNTGSIIEIIFHDIRISETGHKSEVP